MKDSIIRRGFELLKTRPLNEEIDIEKLQREFEIELPPLYYLFAKTFKVGESESKVAYKLSESITQYCAGVFYQSERKPEVEVLFDNFLTVEATISSYDADDDWLEEGYLPIASCGGGGMILLGSKGEMKDQIFFQDLTQNISKLENNIFEFVRSLVLLELSEEELVGNIKYDQLYKKWGENYWRVEEKIIKDRI